MKTKLGDSEFLLCDPNFLVLQEKLCRNIEDQSEFVHDLVTKYMVHADDFIPVFVKEIIWNGVDEARRTILLLAEDATFKNVNMEKRHREICNSRPSSRGFGET